MTLGLCLVLAVLMPGSNGTQTSGALAAPGPQTAAPRDAAAKPKPSATVRGRVTAAASGQPLHRVRITLNGPAPNPPTAVTDTRGTFEVTDVPPGTYAITAARAGYLTVQYGQRRPREAGRTLTVLSGQTIEDIDIALPRGGVLAGRITDELGDPSPGARVEAIELRYIRGRRVAVPARITNTNDAGEYRLSGLEPGAYEIRASTTEVWEADDGKETVVPTTGSTVLGTLATDDGTPPPFPLSGVRVLLEAPTETVLPTVRVVDVAADLSIKFTNLGGPFLFRMRGLPDGWTLGSVRLDDKDITDVPWDVPTGGKEISGLEIIVTQKIGRLFGSVVDSTGKPSAGATVVVFSDQPGLWMTGSRFIRTTRPGTDGRFSITGLPAGTYRAIARDFIEDGQQYDRRFLEEARAGAARFVLGEGASEAITLKLPAAQPRD